MSAYRRKTESGEWRWHYRIWVRLPSEQRIRIYGTPSLNTKAGALAAERAHVERVLNPQPTVREVLAGAPWARRLTPQRRTPATRESCWRFLVTPPGLEPGISA